VGEDCRPLEFSPQTAVSVKPLIRNLLEPLSSEERALGVHQAIARQWDTPSSSTPSKQTCPGPGDLVRRVSWLRASSLELPTTVDAEWRICRRHAASIHVLTATRMDVCYESEGVYETTAIGAAAMGLGQRPRPSPLSKPDR